MIYSRQHTALHAARPASTLAWAGALTAAAVVCTHPVALLILATGMPLIAWWARVPRPVLTGTLFALPFGLIWVITNGLLVRDGLTVVARLGELPLFGQVDVTAEALVAGAILALRALVALQIGLLLSSCVDPDRLLLGVRRVAPRAGLTGAVAMRLAPALADDGRRYADGLRCRADGGNLGGRERLLVMSATVGRAIDRADQVAAMLELRGLRTAGRLAGPTDGRRRRASRHDLSVAASAVAMVGAVAAGVATAILHADTYPVLDMAAPLPAAAWALALLALAAAPLLSRRGTEPPR